MTIVITGGSGFIGSKLSRKLVGLGHRVIVVDIIPPLFTHEQLFFIKHDVTKQALPYGIFEETDAVINLVGTTIFRKWTSSIKAEIIESRIKSTGKIVESIKASDNKPSCFISASAIGFYGDTGDAVVDEQGTKGEGFLSGVVTEWERGAREATEYGVRVVCIRTAPVLGRGGMIKEFMKASRFGFLLNLQKKDFWMSWIHEEDIINTYVFALETTTLQGVVNAVAPENVKHSEFMKVLSRALKRKIIGSMPHWITKKLFGEFFAEMTKSQRVAPRRLLDKGFVFLYPTLESAVKQIVRTPL